MSKGPHKQLRPIDKIADDLQEWADHYGRWADDPRVSEEARQILRASKEVVADLSNQVITNAKYRLEG